MSSKNLTIPLMILAFLAMGGMLWWLSSTVPAEEVQVAEDPDTAAQRGASGTRVRMRDFDQSREEYLGQRIDLTGVEVVGSINDRLLWLAPEDNSVLVVLDSAMAAGEDSPTQGWVGSVVGEYRPMSDSVLTAWTESGVLENDNQRFSASFRSAYLEAIRLNLRPGESGSGGDR